VVCFTVVDYYGLTFAKSLNWSEDKTKAVNKAILFLKLIRCSSSISSHCFAPIKYEDEVEN